MKKTILFLLFICTMLLASCAGRTVDPNYKAMLDGYKAITQQQATQNREIVILEAGDNPITLPPGAKLTVNAPPPEIQYPTMYRDYEREAAYQFWGTVLRSVTVPGLDRLFDWLGQKENRKMLSLGWWSNRQGISFSSTRDINFSGGIGDGGQRGYSSIINTTTTSTVSPEPVINPPVIMPPVFQPGEVESE